RTVHGLAGEAEIGAEFAGRPRQQPGAADIGEKPDADFGHRDPGPLGDDAVAAVRRQANAAPHHHAVHVGDIRLPITRDTRVHDVLLAPEHLAEVATFADAVIEPADVAAGAESSLAIAFDQNQP